MYFLSVDVLKYLYRYQNCLCTKDVFVPSVPSNTWHITHISDISLAYTDEIEDHNHHHGKHLSRETSDQSLI